MPLKMIFYLSTERKHFLQISGVESRLISNFVLSYKNRKNKRRKIWGIFEVNELCEQFTKK